jgi:dephospho-CoA kinase
MIIGLTGGIGSGKSTVAKLFETMGCAIYNSDDRAKELYFKPVIKKAVIDLLGSESYVNETTLNRDYISKKVFSDTNLLQQLNAIIHPAVKEDFVQFQSNFPLNTIIIKESALLFETGIYKDLNYNILVIAPIDLKIERVMQRDSFSKKEIEQRMKAQWSDEQKSPLANAIISNDNQTALTPQVISIIETLKNA